MSTIMRSDQTLRLVQLYHENYPEISKHTQDIEGRRRKMEIWRTITEDLNCSFDTAFTVEQYKKKLQNVQCTSRQKLQTGKRPTDNSSHKFSPAEREFIRLFETAGGRDTSPSLVNGIKVEDLIQQFGVAISDCQSEVGSGSGAATPRLDVGALTPGDLNPDFLSQLLALGPILNNSHLLPNLAPLDSHHHHHHEDQDGVEGNHDGLPQASPAATSSSSSEFGGVGKKPEAGSPVDSKGRESVGSAKRKKRKFDLISGAAGSSVTGDESGDETGRFTAEMLQKQILANQELILQELRVQRSPKPSSELEAQLVSVLESKLDRICECIVALGGARVAKPLEMSVSPEPTDA